MSAPQWRGAAQRDQRGRRLGESTRRGKGPGSSAARRRRLARRLARYSAAAAAALRRGSCSRGCICATAAAAAAWRLLCRRRRLPSLPAPQLLLPGGDERVELGLPAQQGAQAAHAVVAVAQKQGVPAAARGTQGGQRRCGRQAGRQGGRGWRAETPGGRHRVQEAIAHGQRRRRARGADGRAPRQQASERAASSARNCRAPVVCGPPVEAARVAHRPLLRRQLPGLLSIDQQAGHVPPHIVCARRVAGTGRAVGSVCEEAVERSRAAGQRGDRPAAAAQPCSRPRPRPHRTAQRPCKQHASRQI